MDAVSAADCEDVNDARDALKILEEVILVVRVAVKDCTDDTLRASVVVLVPEKAADVDGETVSELRAVTERVLTAAVVAVGDRDADPENDGLAVALRDAVGDTDPWMDFVTDGLPDADALTETVTDGLVDSHIVTACIREPTAVTDGDGEVDRDARADAESDRDMREAEAIDDADELRVTFGVRDDENDIRADEDRLPDAKIRDGNEEKDIEGVVVRVMVLVRWAETLRVTEMAGDAEVGTVIVSEAVPDAVAMDADGVDVVFADELPCKVAECEELSRWLKLTVTNAVVVVDCEAEPDKDGGGEKLAVKDLAADTFTEAVAEPPTNPPTP